jgi:hypothetical protein
MQMPLPVPHHQLLLGSCTGMQHARGSPQHNGLHRCHLHMGVTSAPYLGEWSADGSAAIVAAAGGKPHWHIWCCAVAREPVHLCWRCCCKLHDTQATPAGAAMHPGGREERVEQTAQVVSAAPQQRWVLGA